MRPLDWRGDPLAGPQGSAPALTERSPWGAGSHLYAPHCCNVAYLKWCISWHVRVLGDRFSPWQRPLDILTFGLPLAAPSSHLSQRSTAHTCVHTHNMPSPHARRPQRQDRQRIPVVRKGEGGKGWRREERGDRTSGHVGWQGLVQRGMKYGTKACNGGTIGLVCLLPVLRLDPGGQYGGGGRFSLSASPPPPTSPTHLSAPASASGAWTPSTGQSTSRMAVSTRDGWNMYSVHTTGERHPTRSPVYLPLSHPAYLPACAVPGFNVSVGVLRHATPVAGGCVAQAVVVSCFPQILFSLGKVRNGAKRSWPNQASCRFHFISFVPPGCVIEFVGGPGKWTTVRRGAAVGGGGGRTNVCVECGCVQR